MAPRRRAGRDEAQRNVEENVHSLTGEVRGGGHHRGHAPGIEPDENCQSSETATAQKVASLPYSSSTQLGGTSAHSAVLRARDEVNSFPAAGAGDVRSVGLSKLIDHGGKGTISNLGVT